MTYLISTSTEWANGNAFSAIRADGTVSLWGDLSYGHHFGDRTRFPSNLNNITQVYSNNVGFYAIRKDGTVFADYYKGASEFSRIDYEDVVDQLVNVVAISTTRWSVAALTSGGAVIYFGLKNNSTEAVHPRLQDGVIKVFTTSEAFAALKNDGSVVVWGTGVYGAGMDSQVYEYLESGVADIVSIGLNGNDAFAALKNDGSVIQWGLAGYESPQGIVATGIKKIFSNGNHFMFLTKDGSIKTSTHIPFEPELSLRLASGVVDIISNEHSFTALKDDGSIVTFLNVQNEYPGGTYGQAWVEIGSDSMRSGWYADVSLNDNWNHTQYLENTKRVKNVVANDTGYAAVLDDGSVITWGYSPANDTESIKDKLASGVNKIFSSFDSFAALKDDGSVLTWGSRNENLGADSRSVADLLKSDVKTLSGHQLGFIALKKDGSVVFWGRYNSFNYSVEGPFVSLGDIKTNQFIIPGLNPITGSGVINGTRVGDSILSGPLNDFLYGANGDDLLVSLDGSDFLSGDAGADTMRGGLGNDIYIVNNTGDRVEEAASAGTDTVQSSITHTLRANVENLVLTGTSAINGTGNTQNNSLTGNAANNVLNGGVGADSINGGGGNDTVIGGAGRDVMAGSTGVDKYVYSSVAESGVGSAARDVVTDFQGGSGEKIDLSTIDAYAPATGNQAFTYIGANLFSGLRGEVRFASSILQLNTGTDKTPNMEIALTGVTSFQSSFLVL